MNTIPTHRSLMLAATIALAGCTLVQAAKMNTPVKSLKSDITIPAEAEVKAIVTELDRELTQEGFKALHARIKDGQDIRDWTGDQLRAHLDNPKTMPLEEMTAGNWKFNGWFPRNVHTYYQHYRATGDPFCITQLEAYAEWIDYLLKQDPLLIEHSRFHDEYRKKYDLEGIHKIVGRTPAHWGAFSAHATATLVTLERMHAGIEPINKDKLATCEQRIGMLLKYLSYLKGAAPAEMDRKFLTPYGTEKEKEERVAYLKDRRYFWNYPWNHSGWLIPVMGMTIKSMELSDKISDTHRYDDQQKHLLNKLNFWITMFVNYADKYEKDGKPYVCWAYHWSLLTKIKPNGRVELLRGEDTGHGAHDVRALIYIWELGLCQDLVTTAFVEGMANTAVDCAFLAPVTYPDHPGIDHASTILLQEVMPKDYIIKKKHYGFGCRAPWWIPISGFRPEFYALYTKYFKQGKYDFLDSSFNYCRYLKEKKYNNNLLFVAPK